MEKLWAGDLHGRLDAAADDFNASIRVDARMAGEDIAGSLAHSAMLAARGILSREDAAAIAEGLGGIAEDLSCGRLSIDDASEDIHTFIERELTRRRMEKRPGRIKTACLLLTVEMILMFMVPLVMMIVGTLAEVGF